ncbi:MAG: beta-lactamase family protein, partial [Sedimentisphaerales bacterium]|nr:beta-lactamase family protein [Sedimentisphaerales bacterium]
GYGILEHLVAEVSQTPFDEFIEKEIFLPLGMSHAYMDVHPDGRHLEALRYNGDKQPIPSFDFDHRGASAMYADVHDLLLFGLFHLKSHLPHQRPILSDNAIEAMRRPLPGDPHIGPVVLGWSVNAHSRWGNIAEHTGSMPGVSTILTLAIDHNIVITALANSQHKRIYTLPAEILKCMVISEIEENNKPSSSDDHDDAAQTENTLVFTFPRQWRGAIETPGGPIPVVMDMPSREAVKVILGRGEIAVDMQDISFRKLYIFHGQCSSNINTAFLGDPHTLKFELFLRDDGKRLEGSVSALSSLGSIPYWIALE